MTSRSAFRAFFVLCLTSRTGASWKWLLPHSGHSNESLIHPYGFSGSRILEPHLAQICILTSCILLYTGVLYRAFVLHDTARQCCHAEPQSDRFQRCPYGHSAVVDEIVVAKDHERYIAPFVEELSLVLPLLEEHRNTSCT